MQWTFATLVLVAIAGCEPASDAPGGQAATDPVTSIQVSPATPLLVLGESISLVAAARDSEGRAVDGVKFTWYSTSPQVASVSEAGVVSALEVGSASITVSGGGQVAVAVVTVVSAPIASLGFSSMVPSLTVGERVPFAVVARDAAGRPLSGRQISWTSSDPSTGSVSAAGEVTGLTPGETIITASSEGKTAAAKVTVVEAPIVSVAIRPSATSLIVGQVQQLSLHAEDAKGSTVGASAVWSSSAAGVATVANNGTVTAVAPGTAQITAAVSGLTAVATVSVSQALPASVTISPEYLKIDVGQTSAVELVVKDAAGRTIQAPSVTWRSTAPRFATVSSTGVVTGLSGGSAVITASVNGRTAQATVVVDPSIVAVTVVPATVDLSVGLTRQLQANARDARGQIVSDRSVTWSSSNGVVATVSATGLVSALAVGTSTIRATIAGKTAEAVVAVTNAVAASVVLSEPAVSLTVGGGGRPVFATFRDAAGNPITGRLVDWATSNPAVATVSNNGVITAQGAGTATITARLDDQTGRLVVTVEPAPVSTVSVTPGVANLTVGQVQNLVAEPRNAAGAPLSGRSVAWSTSAATVATVSSTGRVTAVGAGSATITASSEGKSGSASIVVVAAPIATVRITPPTATLAVGASTPLSAAGFDAVGNQVSGRTVGWQSSNVAVATVGASGVVTAVAPGLTLVTATIDGKSATSSITVTAIPVASVSITPAALSLTVGQTGAMTPVARDASGGALVGRAAAWLSLTPAVATVSGTGLVTGVAAGSAVIRATIEGRTGSAIVTVSLAPVASVTVSPAASSLTVGATAQLTAAPKDAGGAPLAGRSVLWGSGTPAVATVSGTGLVTAVAPGTAIVTATSEGVRGTASITVSVVPVSSVVVTPTSVSLDIGATRTIVATARDAGGNSLAGRPANWSTTAPAVATVSGAGVVTGIGVGTARIEVTIEGRSAISTVTVTAAPVASVVVSPSSSSVVVGTTLALSAVPRDGTGGTLTGRSVIWGSSNPSVATVSAVGLVTALAPGSITITATSEGRSGTAVVTVSAVPVASVVVAPASVALLVGESGTLVATAKDAAGNTLAGRVPTWSSSAVGIATVSAGGIVTAVGIGTATITARIEGRSAAAIATVSAVPVASVVVTPSSASLVVGQTSTLTATPRDAGGAALVGRSLSWSSSQPAVATVSTAGAVTAVAPGTATISATTEGQTGTSVIAVSVVPVAAVTLSPTSAALTLGQTTTLVATGRDAGGNPLGGRPVTWTSTASTVATVSTAGIVTAVGIGSATITARIEGVSASAAITVTPIPVASVAVSPATAGLVVGQTASLTATPRDAGGGTLTGRSVTWTSSQLGVATVSASGTVTAIAPGVANISATVEGRVGSAVIAVSVVPVAAVALNPASAGLTVGQTTTLVATGRDAAGNTLPGRLTTWSSTASTVATVSTAGLVTGIGVGSATISATIEGISANATITVSAVPVASVIVSPATASLVVGQTQTLTASPRDAAGAALSGRTIVWTSSQPAVATVSVGGVVTAVAAGTASVTATVEGRTGSTAIVVSTIPVASVGVTPSSVALTVGDTRTVTATVRDAAGNPLAGRSVSWSSADLTIVTVSPGGLITAVGAGATSVSATVEGQSGSVVVTVSPVPVATVAVLPSNSSLVIGQTQMLSATPKDAAGSPLTGRVTTWSSSNVSVASVSATGLVTAVSIGGATITATVEGRAASASVTVVAVPVASVAITPATLTVTVGLTAPLSAVVRDADGLPLTGRPVTWTSNNPTIATVGADGLVTGLAVGSAVITGSADGVSGTSAVTIVPAPVAAVAVTPGTASLMVGQTQPLTSLATDAANNPLSGRPTVWSTSNAAVATVSVAGLVAAVTVGTATITATVEGKSGSALITVVSAPVTTVVVSPASIDLPVGQSQVLSVTPRDASGNPVAGRVVSWSSSSSSVASVSSTGTVTAVAAGTATVSATVEGVTGSASVAVTNLIGTTAAFPLRTVAGRRYLVDAAGNPFLVHGDSPWTLIASLTRDQIDQYFADRQQKGFNSVIIELIEKKFATNAPNNAYGAPPFLTPGDFSTPNEAYFAHAEYAIRKAAERGIVVFLTPLYLGWEGGDEGWQREAVANGVTKMAAWGRYVATRFSGLNNIVWIHGGDYVPASLSIVRAVAEAVRAVDTRSLTTYHGVPGSSAAAIVGSDTWLTLNNIYSYETVVAQAAAEYARSTMPFFLIEARYEQPIWDAVVIRSQAYHAVLGGATGQLFGNRPIWYFGAGWQAALGSPASTTLPHLRRLMEAFQWWTMVPEVAQTLTAGAGTAPTQATFARASNRSFAIGYTPSVRNLTLDLTRLAGPRVRARWFDPTNGVYTEVAGSPFALGSVTLRPTGNNSAGQGDWAIVLESVP